MNTYIPYDGDKNDSTGFRAKARKHQAEFREQIMEEDCTDPYGSVLSEEAGRKGVNFYPGFGILEAVKDRYQGFRQLLYCHTLRSEHIPFNFFVPLKKNKDLLKALLNHYLQNTIEEIVKIEIEFAPSPFKNYLNDRTSFDCCISYKHVDGTQGMVGIETKYTEHSYKPGTKELQEVNDPTGIYYRASRSSGLYKEGSLEVLKGDKFRQIWRNHLLGARILDVDALQYKHFTLATLYPAGNTYIHNACKTYKELLNDNAKDKFLPITFESFLETLSSLAKEEQLKHWAYYLKLRYIVPE